MLNRKGIYFIGSKTTRRVYIGSTATSYKKRLKQHLDALLKKKHLNKSLQLIVNKYGINDLEVFFFPLGGQAASILIFEHHLISLFPLSQLFNYGIKRYKGKAPEDKMAVAYSLVYTYINNVNVKYKRLVEYFST